MIERYLEKFLFSSRWILAPSTCCSSRRSWSCSSRPCRAFHFVLHALTSTEIEVILGVLALIDLTLTGSLVIIMIFSGYEASSRTSSRREHEGLAGMDGQDRLYWPQAEAAVVDRRHFREFRCSRPS